MSSSSFNRTLLPLGLSVAEEYMWLNARGKGEQKPLFWHTDDAGARGLWQSNLLQAYEELLPDLGNLLGHKATANIDSVEVNNWFQADNFPRLIPEKPVDPLVFYIGMIYMLRNLSWLDGEADEHEPESGTSYTVTPEKKPAYRLSASKNAVRFYEVGLDFPVVVFPTWDTSEKAKSRISVVAWLADKPTYEWDLVVGAQNVVKRIKNTAEVNIYGGAILPNIKVESELNLGEGKAKGLWTKSYDGRTVSVEDAGMFLRNILCPQGPLSEGAAFMAMRYESFLIEPKDKPDFVFDRPFVFSFVDFGLRTPTVYTSVHVEPEDFSSTRVEIN